MKIEGNYNEDNKELIIKVDFDDDTQATTFQKYFIDMVKKMAEDGGAVLLDPNSGDVYGDIEGHEDEVNEAMHKLAKEVAKQANQAVSDKFTSKFL